MSTLLLRNAARTIFCTTKTSSLVQREEVMPPMLSTPCAAWISRSRRAAKSMASSQETSRHGSVMASRIIGDTTRSGWVAYPQAKRPLTHEWPSLAPPSL